MVSARLGMLRPIKGRTPLVHEAALPRRRRCPGPLLTAAVIAPASIAEKAAPHQIQRKGLPLGGPVGSRRSARRTSLSRTTAW